MSAVEFLSNWVRERRGRIAIAMVLIVWIYFLVAFGEQAWRADQLRADVNEQRQDIQRIRDENASIRRQLDRLEGDAYDAYVEGVARRNLGLTQPDQSVVVVHWVGDEPVTTSPQEETEVAQPDTPTWQRWLNLFVGDN